MKYNPIIDIEVGARVPDFILVDEKDKTIRLSDLRGSPAVLYLYPKDSSAGCTQEACDFRDVYHDLRELDCAIYGISPDTKEDHEIFSQENDLPFELCVDPDLNMVKAFGVWGEYQLTEQEAEVAKSFGFKVEDNLKTWSVVRSTFLIDKDGILMHKWVNVNFRGHASSVRDQLNTSFKFDIAF